MATNRITIPLDPETAKAYRAAPSSDKKKMQALVSLWLRGLAAEEPAALKRILDELSEKAVRRGLTAERLEALLKGA
jgi:hypothetical protein